MKLILIRDVMNDQCTLGKLFIDDVYQCETLEDKDRKLENGGVKVHGETCIPRGLYKVEITYSNRFKRDLPILLNVPQFEGIRIHPGNTSANTEGCILVGERRHSNCITMSRIAFYDLFEKIENEENLEIEIK